MPKLALHFSRQAVVYYISTVYSQKQNGDLRSVVVFLNRRQ
jgi:hypothetical protein